MKELLKSANIWQSYSKNKSGPVFSDSQCSWLHVNNRSLVRHKDEVPGRCSAPVVIHWTTKQLKDSRKNSIQAFMGNKKAHTTIAELINYMVKTMLGRYSTSMLGNRTEKHKDGTDFRTVYSTPWMYWCCENHQTDCNPRLLYLHPETQAIPNNRPWRGTWTVLAQHFLMPRMLTRHSVTRFKVSYVIQRKTL